MRPYHVLYTERAWECIRHLPPLVKPAIRLLIEHLAEEPTNGKPLRAELAGYWSARFQRWRVIYMVEEDTRRLVIHLIERRKSVYESLKSLAV